MNSKKNEYEAIMTKIRAGLTGDAGDDIRYLMETTEHYKDHPLGREISRECGRMIWELTPNEQKQQFTEAFDKDLGVIGERLDEAERERNKKNVTGALALVEDAVRIIEDCGLFKDDEVSEYKSFGELFEDLLYNHRYDPKKEVRQISLPIVRAYMMLGSLLIDNGRPEDARKALAKGLKWDPVSFMLTVEYTETFRITRDIDTFYKQTLELFRCAFRRKDLGRCYRNLAFYFIEKKLYPVAAGCLKYSLNFDPSAKEYAENEYAYLCQQAGKQVRVPTLEQLNGFAGKYGFPMGADKEIVGVAWMCAEAFMRAGNEEPAWELFGIIAEFAEEDERKELENELKQMKGKK